MATYRLATAMVPLAVLLTLRACGTLSVASFALALWTLACAGTQTVWAGAARLRERPTVVVLGVATAAAQLALAAASGRGIVLVLAVIAGATLPPVTALARAALGSSLTPARRERAFGLESTVASAAFLAAPLCVGVANRVALAAPLAVCGGLLIASSAGYAVVAVPLTNARNMAVSPDASTTEPEPQGRSWLPVVMAGGSAYAALACVEVAAVARLRDASHVAVTLAAWSAASLLSGLVLSISGRARVRHVAPWALPVGCVGLALLSFGNWGGRWGFAATLVLSGVAVAPLLGTVSAQLARRSPPTRHRSSYALLQSISWFGAALGTAVAGLLVAVELGWLLLVAGALAAVTILTVRHPGGAVSLAGGSSHTGSGLRLAQRWAHTVRRLR
jgi:hypothetical protein